MPELKVLPSTLTSRHRFIAYVCEDVFPRSNAQHRPTTEGLFDGVILDHLAATVISGYHSFIRHAWTPLVSLQLCQVFATHKKCISRNTVKKLRSFNRSLTNSTFVFRYIVKWSHTLSVVHAPLVRMAFSLRDHMLCARRNVSLKVIY